LDPTNREAAVGANVDLTDSQGKSFTATTNEAGNFFVRPDELTPTYPMKVAVRFGGVTTSMTADVGRDGACAACHSDPPGPSSPGHVYVTADGGTP
jgi:hypothetical protein